MKERLWNLWVSVYWFFRPPKGVDLDGTFFTWQELDELGHERAWEIAREQAEFRRYLRWWFWEAQYGLTRPPPLHFVFYRAEREEQG